MTDISANAGIQAPLNLITQEALRTFGVGAGLRPAPRPPPGWTKPTAHGLMMRRDIR